MTKAAQIELSLYRSGMLRRIVNAAHLETACKSIARHVARIARHRLNECNGIQRWDAKAQMMCASWTDADQAMADRQTAESRKAIQDALHQFTAPGVAFNWYTDPRAGAVVRLHHDTKDNTRDCFV